MGRLATRIVILVVFLLILVGAHFFRQRKAEEQPGAGPSITFEEVDRMIQSGPTDAQLKSLSGRLKGARVRWTGKVTSIGDDNTVYVATHVFPPDVQFQLPRDVGEKISTNQDITFTGTIERISMVNTFPPMSHAYVFLENVDLH